KNVLNMPRSPLVVTADKAYASQTARQQIKDEGALPIIPNVATRSNRPIVRSGSIGSGTKSKTTSVVSRIGGASPPATTTSLEIFLAAATLIGALFWIKL